MLIEVKVKVARIIDGKTRKRTETYILDKQFFSEAEYRVTAELNEEQNSNLISSFEIISLRQSSIKEVCTQYTGNIPYVATLIDIFLDDAGNEKTIKYKVLLWAEDLHQAHDCAQNLVQQGYDLHIESIKEVNYIYLEEDDTQQQWNTAGV